MADITLEDYSDDLTKIEALPEGKAFRILFDASVRKFKIICRSISLLEELQDAFSAANPSAFFVSRYGYKVDAKVYAVNKFGYFSCGLLFEVIKWIKQNFGDLTCLIMSDRCKRYILDYLTPLKAQLAKQGAFQVSNLSEDLGRNNELRRLGKQPYEFRDYQQASVEALISKGYGKGLIEIPTAGGKSFILANFIWNIHKCIDSHFRYLILVPNKQLVSQFYKDLIDYGIDRHNVTQFTAGLKRHEQFNPDAMVIVANRQYMFKNKDKLPKIDVLICDEVHQCLASASQDFIERLNCRIKIGCSGTLPRDKFQRWQLIGLFSQVVYTEEITTLQKRGYISKLKITLLKIKDMVVENDRNYLFHTNPLRRYHVDEFGNSDIEFDEAYNAEHEYFSKNYRELYQPVLKYLLGLDSNTLILFDRIEIGTSLHELAEEMYKGKKQVFYIDGSIDVNVREKVRDEFEQSDGNLLIAQSATFATGINIKRLTNIVFLTSSKAFARTIQSIGRTLRLHSSKSEAHLIDVSWNYKYSTRHLAERLAIYKKMYQKKPDETIELTV